MLFIDRLSNLASGLGGGRDKSASNSYVLTPISRGELEAAYRSDWLARKIIDLPPLDMTREWRDWQAEEPQIEALEHAERRLRVRDKIAAGLQQGRLYGGAALYMGVRNQDPAQELDVDAVRLGDLEYIHVVSRYEITASEIIRDPLSSNFGEPSYYEVSSASIQARIHPSRIIRFIGSAAPDALTIGDGWGDPTLQILYDAIQSATSAAQHIAALIPEAKTDVIGVPSLSEHLATDRGTARITARFLEAGRIKSMFNMLLIESGEMAGETWQQKKIEFGQFPELIRTYLQIASGAADIPVTRLLGQSPSGMNATGDSDIRNYYDGLASKQETELRPALDRLDEVLIRSALGSRPPDVYYEFTPLWQLSEKEKADIGKAEAETDQIYANSALVPAPVLERAVRNRLIESGRYPGIEAAYSEFDMGALQAVVEPQPAPAQAKTSDFDPNQPRDPAGRWTTEAGGDPSPHHGLTSPDNLTPIEDYTGDGNVEINRHLRGVRAGDASTLGKIAALDKLLGEGSLPEPAVVYRGITGEAAARLTAAGIRKGSIFRDAGFVSTSRSERVAMDFAARSGYSLTLEIRLPKGSKALDISGQSQAPLEQEILMARGPSFRVLSLDRAKHRLIAEHIEVASGKATKDSAGGTADTPTTENRFVMQSLAGITIDNSGAEGEPFDLLSLDD